MVVGSQCKRREEGKRMKGRLTDSVPYAVASEMFEVCERDQRGGKMGQRGEKDDEERQGVADPPILYMVLTTDGGRGLPKYG
jgi:hypothetical protein